MGIFLIVAGSVLGIMCVLLLLGATNSPVQIFAGEMGICGAALFAGGAIVMAVDKLRIVVMQVATKKLK